MKWLCICLIALMGSAACTQAQDSSQLIFQPRDGYSVHASSVVELPGGNLLAVWFGGSYEGAKNVGIWGSEHTAKGWTSPKLLVKPAGAACWNPVVFYSHDGRLWLAYKYGPNPQHWLGARIYSDDNGKTWSKPDHLSGGLTGPIRAKPLILKDGTILAGTSTETPERWRAFVDRSTDNGKSWQRIGPIDLMPDADIPDAGAKAAAAEGGEQLSVKLSGTHTSLYPPTKTTIGIIQPSLIDLGGGHIRMYARCHCRSARITTAISDDNGLHWGPVHLTDLPNPNSGIDAVRLSDGRVVMVYNPSYNRRNVLALAVSSDGEHFTRFKTLDKGEGQYSYPAMVQAKNGDLLITYTSRRQSIGFVRIPVAEVPAP